MVHELKIWPQYFRDVWAGRKTFEVRRKDRDYRYGDMLVLREFDPKANSYTGNQIVAEITYILDHQDFVLPGHVILGIKVLKRQEAQQDAV